MGETVTQPQVEDNFAGLDEEYQARGRQQLIDRERAARRAEGVPEEFRTPPPAPRQPRITDPSVRAAIDQLPERLRPLAEAEYEALVRRGGDGTATATAQRDLALAQGERAAREAAVTQHRAELERYRSRRVELPDFVPTQENAMSLGTLFGLVGVVGTLMGGRGQQSAIGAMNAMSGMMAGWRQGRTDLYNRERQKYEQEMKRVQEQNAALQRDFQDALNLMKTDLDAGLARAREAAARHGVSIAGAAAARQGAEGVRNWFTSLRQTMTQLEQNQSRLQGTYQRVVDPNNPSRILLFNPRTNEYLKDPQTGEPIEAAPTGRAGAGAAGGRRGDYMGFGDIVSTAANEAAASIRNIVGLSATSTTGVFQGRNTTGLLNSPLGVMANVVTSEDTQRYNVELANFGKFLAQVQRGGRAVPVSDMEASQRAFAIKEGDTYGTVLTKLAAMRQQLERALEVRIASPNTAEELKAILRRNQHDIEMAIPFTVDDVNKYLQGRDGFRTFGDLIRDTGISSSETSAGIADQLYQRPATEAFGAYDPDQYEYRIDPQTGNIQRRRRGQ
jgi:hypothetical protein